MAIVIDLDVFGAMMAATISSLVDMLIEERMVPRLLA